MCHCNESLGLNSLQKLLRVLLEFTAIILWPLNDDLLSAFLTWDVLNKTEFVCRENGVVKPAIVKKFFETENLSIKKSD